MTPEVPGQLDALDLITEAVDLSTNPVDSPVGFGTNSGQTLRRPAESLDSKAEGQSSGAAEREGADDHA